MTAPTQRTPAATAQLHPFDRSLLGLLPCEPARPQIRMELRHITARTLAQQMNTSVQRTTGRLISCELAGYATGFLPRGATTLGWRLSRTGAAAIGWHPGEPITAKEATALAALKGTRGGVAPVTMTGPDDTRTLWRLLLRGLIDSPDIGTDLRPLGGAAPRWYVTREGNHAVRALAASAASRPPAHL